ncbi:hypothetical protein PC116_g30554, partial [Phytophthora cactorum]
LYHLTSSLQHGVWKAGLVGNITNCKEDGAALVASMCARGVYCLISFTMIYAVLGNVQSANSFLLPSLKAALWRG